MKTVAKVVVLSFILSPLAILTGCCAKKCCPSPCEPVYKCEKMRSEWGCK